MLPVLTLAVPSVVLGVFMAFLTFFRIDSPTGMRLWPGWRVMLLIVLSLCQLLICVSLASKFYSAAVHYGVPGVFGTVPVILQTLAVFAFWILSQRRLDWAQEGLVAARSRPKNTAILAVVRFATVGVIAILVLVGCDAYLNEIGAKIVLATLMFGFLPGALVFSQYHGAPESPYFTAETWRI